MDHFSSAPSEFTSLPFYHPHTNDARPRVAISACLAGEPVRYDGASRDLPALRWLQQRLQLVNVCPEVGAGLSVPRPPVQLIAGRADSNPRAIGRDDPTLDVTDALTAFAHASLADLDAAGSLCGYLFKSRSPSCGLGSTPLFDRDGRQLATTSGIQAAWFQHRQPWLSFGEETGIADRADALAFELRCRFVYDWLHAGDAQPASLLRHYRDLFERLGIDTAAKTTVDKTACLAALQRRCAQLSPAQLLETIRDWAP